MKVMIFNGSPRRVDGNTVTVLRSVQAGAESAGAETELVQLYGLNFSGCISCFSCKRLDRKSNGVCAVRDDLTPVLERVRDADAFVIGTPVYYGAESAATRAFLERLCFPYNRYAKDRSSLFPRKIRTAMIYTMNVRRDSATELGYDRHFALTEGTLARHFGTCETLVVPDTLQYRDYRDYESEMFDVDAKRKFHDEQFPKTCQLAAELGMRLVLTRVDG